MQGEQFQLHAEIEDRHWWFRGRRTIMRRLVDQLLVREPRDETPLIIDVGCGTGGNLASLVDSYNCVGIDTSADAIALARQRFADVDFRVGFAPNDVEDCLPAAKLVTLMDVLEHVPDDFALLRQLLAASRPGTQFLITVPADLDLWSEHDESFGHWRRYDMPRFARIWQDQPVQVRLLSHYNARLFPVVRWIRHRNRRRGQATGAAGTDFSIPTRPLNALLERVFAGEASALLNTLDQPTSVAYGHGVSLVAVLERTPGEVSQLEKPHDVAADYFNPEVGELIAAV